MRDQKTKAQIKTNTKNKLRDNTHPLSSHPNPDMKQPPPYCCFIVMCGKSYCKSVIWSVLIGSIFVFSKFMVAPEAFNFWKKKSLLALLMFVLLEENLNHLCIVIILFVLCNWEFLFLICFCHDLYYLW